MKRYVFLCVLCFVCNIAEGTTTGIVRLHDTGNKYGYRIYSSEWEILQRPTDNGAIAYYLEQMTDAAEKRDIMAMFNLARIYYYGATGVSQDIDKAVYWS